MCFGQKQFNFVFNFDRKQGQKYQEQGAPTRSKPIGALFLFYFRPYIFLQSECKKISDSCRSMIIVKYLVKFCKIKMQSLWVIHGLTYWKCNFPMMALVRLFWLARQLVDPSSVCHNSPPKKGENSHCHVPIEALVIY